MIYITIYFYILQDRQQYQLKSLCKECLLTVAKKTLELVPVIGILNAIGKEFTSFVNYTVITGADLQKIWKATTNGETLFLIREVCNL